jgi:hypothetical protein
VDFNSRTGNWEPAIADTTIYGRGNSTQRMTH